MVGSGQPCLPNNTVVIYGVTMWEGFSGGQTPNPGMDPMSLVVLLREGKRLEPPQNTAYSTDNYD